MIVSNTSPLRYLIAVGEADLIRKVFGEVVIPPAVFAELTHPSGREDVRQWIEQCPAWLNMRGLDSAPSHDLVTTLDPGEREAIQLALEIQPDFVLMDERLGRRAATALGLPVIGALGLLGEAYGLHHIAEPLQVLDEMRRIGFRVSPPLYRKFEQKLQSMGPQ